jgi:hypothetical protein
MQLFEAYLGAATAGRVGAQHALNAEYFKRIDACMTTANMLKGWKRPMWCWSGFPAPPRPRPRSISPTAASEPEKSARGHLRRPFRQRESRCHRSWPMDAADMIQRRRRCSASIQRPIKPHNWRKSQALAGPSTTLALSSGAIGIDRAASSLSPRELTQLRAEEDWLRAVPPANQARLRCSGMRW